MIRPVIATPKWLPFGLCLLWISGCSGDKPAAPAQPQAVPAAVITVKAADVPYVGEFVGETESSQEVEIRARVEGFLDLPLPEALPVRKADLVPYAPVTETRVGGNMTLDELCLAAIDMSDNVAANILIGHLGGPEAVTQFFRSVGDPTSRLDRIEPKLNDFASGDERDTTSPAAMSETLRALLLGDVLSPEARGKLAEWMRHGGVTGALLRAEAEDAWLILDKSGSGSHTRNLVAVIQPEGGAPWIATMFISDTDAEFEVRNEALKDLGRAVVAVVRE